METLSEFHRIPELRSPPLRPADGTTEGKPISDSPSPICHLPPSMLHAALHEPGTFEPWLVHPTWRRAIDWLRAMPSSIPLGIHEILGRDMFASVQEYETIPRAEARFESHRQHVDLQYTLEGAEIIDWAPRHTLQPDGEFDVEKDFGFWLPPAEPVTALLNAPGRFAIFFPADAHRPKVRAAGTDKVRKLVIKIRMELLG